jgi:hypothetical protein
MEVLGREIPEALTELHDAIVELRPDATIRFTKSLADEAPVKAFHTADGSGNSEIRFAEGWDDRDLAHELLHVMLYRRGFPQAASINGLGDYALTGRTLSCCVSHASLTDEVPDLGGIAEFWPPHPTHPAGDETPLETTLVNAWRIAEFGDEPDADTATQALATRLRAEMERCRAPGATRWRRSMVELLQHLDGLEQRAPDAFGPLKSVTVTLVVTEPQLTRPADRMVELVPLGGESIGFVHKQDGGLFHYRFAAPGRKRVEIAELQTELRKSKTEPFLDAYWVPYTVDLRVKK